MSERKPLPDWLLERYAAGDLTEREADEVRARLEHEDPQGMRLASLRADNEETLATWPPEVIAERVALRAGRPNPVRKMARFAWLPTATTFLLIGGIWLVQPLETPHPEHAVETTRIKGLAPSLNVYRQTGTEAERIGEKEGARAGDVLQVAYIAGGARYGAVVSVDGRGMVTQHLPAQGSRAVELVADGETLLPFAYQLDDAPDFERFYFVTADEPFDLAEVLGVAEAGEGAELLVLPETLQQTTLLVRKVAP